MSTTDASEKRTTIADIMVAQSPTIDGWICPTCKNHEGGLKCAKNIFIAFVGANTSECYAYEKGLKCRHCAKIT